MNKNCNSFNISMVLINLVHFSDSASLIFFRGKESGPALTIQVNQLSMWSILPCRTTPNFFILIDYSINTTTYVSTYLSIPTRMPSIAGLQYLLEYYMLLLFVKTQFFICLWESEPAGIWTRISETKSGYANPWAILHWRLKNT